MTTLPDENRFDSFFSNIQPAPGQRFYRRMKHAAWTPAGIARRRAWTAAGLSLFLAAVILVATPQGRAWAQTVVRSFLGYFSVTEKTSLPIPATPQALPTYSIEPALLPFEPAATPAADPLHCGKALTWLTATPRCQMLNAQADAGFNLQVFGTTDLSLKVENAEFSQKRILVTYLSKDGSLQFQLTQGLGDFPQSASSTGAVLSNAVQQVVVGNHPAELVVGDFVYYVGKSTQQWTTWLPPVQLRWQAGGHWYAIRADRLAGTGEKSEADQLEKTVLALGNGLTPLSADASDLAGNVDKTPEMQVGFHIQTPKVLPEGCSLEGVWFGTQNERLAGTVVVSYGCMSQGQWVNGITLSETLASNQAVDFAQSFTGFYAGMKYELIKDETIQIGPATGRYLVRKGDPGLGDSGSTALIWQQGGLKLMLQPTYAESFSGGRFTQAELITIAESLK